MMSDLVWLICELRMWLEDMRDTLAIMLGAFAVGR